jgi:isopentenyldiphosphate isomerase
MTEFWDILDKNGNPTGIKRQRSPWPLPEDKLQDGEYHLVVQIWILNSRGEFLISRRTPNKSWPLMWECTGGSAVAGQSSLAAALAETKEELGIGLNPANGRVFKRFIKEGSKMIIDVWLFRQDIDISTITLQPDETCDAMWASKEKIRQMLKDEQFVGYEFFPYLDELFDET